MPRLFSSGALDLRALAGELFDERQAWQNERINEALAECGLGRYVEARELAVAHEAALWHNAQVDRWAALGMRCEMPEGAVSMVSEPISVKL